MRDEAEWIRSRSDLRLFVVAVPEQLGTSLPYQHRQRLGWHYNTFILQSFISYTALHYITSISFIRAASGGCSPCHDMGMACTRWFLPVRFVASTTRWRKDSPPSHQVGQYNLTVNDTQTKNFRPSHILPNTFVTVDQQLARHIVNVGKPLGSE